MLLISMDTIPSTVCVSLHQQQLRIIPSDVSGVLGLVCGILMANSPCHCSGSHFPLH